MNAAVPVMYTETQADDDARLFGSRAWQERKRAATERKRWKELAKNKVARTPPYSPERELKRWYRRYRSLSDALREYTTSHDITELGQAVDPMIVLVTELCSALDGLPGRPSPLSPMQRHIFNAMIVGRIRRINMIEHRFYWEYLPKPMTARDAADYFQLDSERAVYATVYRATQVLKATLYD